MALVESIRYDVEKTIYMYILEMYIRNNVGQTTDLGTLPWILSF